MRFFKLNVYSVAFYQSTYTQNTLLIKDMLLEHVLFEVHVFNQGEIYGLDGNNDLQATKGNRRIYSLHRYFFYLSWAYIFFLNGVMKTDWIYRWFNQWMTGGEKKWTNERLLEWVIKTY